MSPVTSAPTLGLLKVSFSSLSLETIFMTPKKEHPKVIIVKIIFLFCVVRLSKSITDSLVLKQKVWKSYYQQPLVCL